MSTLTSPGSKARDELRSALFYPSHVALVGASSDPAKASSRPTKFLQNANYPLRISLINRRPTPVDGAIIYPTLLDLSDAPEHVFVMTPTASVLETIEQCVSVGARVATILSGGFAEAGPHGVELQRRVTEVARSGSVRVRLLGPNSLGLVNLHRSLRLTGNAVFADTSFSAGGTFLASQSGSLIGALVSRGAAKGQNFSTVISVGGEADLSIGEICSLTLDDDNVTSYALFLETICHAEQLAEFAEEAVRRDKPVIAYKLGESELSAQLSRSHTGALAGKDDVASAFLRAHGIARVRSLDGLLEALPLARRIPIRSSSGPRERVAVVSTTGGGAAMLVDQLDKRGIVVSEPSEATYRRLAERGVSVARAPIVDLTLSGARYDTMKATLEVLLSAPEFTLVVAVVGSSARSRPDLVVAPIVDSADTSCPLAAFLVPDAPEAMQLLRTVGIPSFTSPEVCADVAAAISGRRLPRRREIRYVAHIGARLDEASSYERLAQLGIMAAPHVVLTAHELEAPLPLPFDYPVVVKMLAEDVAHKSDLGGVIRSVGGEAELRDGARTILKRLAESHLPLERVLVQQMVQGVGEFLIGYQVDDQVGPIVLLAAGGTEAELYRDRSVRLAPIDDAVAGEMLDEVVATKILGGFRGRPIGDRAGLQTALVAISRLAADHQVAEAEVNPLIVRADGRGTLAVDASVTLTKP